MPLLHSRLLAGLLLGLAAGAVLPAAADTMSMPMAVPAGPMAVPAGPMAVPAGPTHEQPFIVENNIAMAKMMTGMEIKPTGDIDRDFVAMMEAHHRGAIEMAQAVLRYGKNEQIRRIAQEIIVDQLQEIAAMRVAIGEPPPPSAAAPTMPDMK